jgi:hypothetical protein
MMYQQKARTLLNHSSRSLGERYQSGLSSSPVEGVR